MRAAATSLALALVLIVLTPIHRAAAQEIPSSSRLEAFAGVGYTSGESRDGFRLGEVLAQLNVPLSARWSFLGEAVAEPRSDGLGLSLDRLAVDVELTEAIGLQAGRLRTPIGHANVVLDRASWTRTTLSPPALVSPESGLLPTHTVGLQIEGAIPAQRLEPLGLDFAVALGNGRDTDFARPGDAGTLTGGVATTVALRARPAMLGGVRLGVSYYGHRPDEDLAVNERIMAGHIVWDDGAPEVIGEAARIRHARRTNDDEATYARAGYLQLGYRLPVGERSVTPYLRLERVRIDDADPLYAGRLAGTESAALGLRHDLAAFSAIKAELRAVRGEGDEDWSRVVAVGLDLALGMRDDPPPAPVASSDDARPETVDAAADTADDEASNEEERGVDRNPPPPAAASVAARAPTQAEEPSEPSLEGSIAIVAHPDVEVDDVALPELRRIFRGDRQYWTGEERIVLLVRTPEAHELDIVLPRLYRMDEDEFRQFWLNRIFRNAVAAGPKVVSDVETAQQLVAALPGAITFMPADQVTPGLHVLRVDGKLPGEAGYPLQ